MLLHHDSLKDYLMKWVIINKIRKKEKFDINERKKDNT